VRVLLARLKEGGRSWGEDGYYIGLVAGGGGGDADELIMTSCSYGLNASPSAAAGILRNLNKRAQANELLQELTKHQLPDGSLRNAATSITRSNGASLFVETTRSDLVAAHVNWHTL